MDVPFTKMQGLGNDFVVIDATQRAISLSPEQAAAIADRRFGVGCDQVLLIEPPPTPKVDFGYRIINADGSEVGQCGNGVRCVARYVREHGLSREASLRFATSTAVMTVRSADGQWQVDMGAPQFAPDAVPFVADSDAALYSVSVGDETVELGVCSMGNPHAVLLVDDVQTAPVATLGPQLERHARFPERANIGFAAVRSRQSIDLRVWERGAGETLACGSGACAAVAVLRRWDLIDESVAVQVPGGSLQIQWPGVGHKLLMTGPAEIAFVGTLTL